MIAHPRRPRVALRVLGSTGLFSVRPAASTIEDMTTTLITGANKGLGRETAQRLLADGHEVWVAARDPARGLVAADELGARFVELDVTDDASVAAAAQRVGGEGGLDVLVNNAGILGPRRDVGELTADDVRAVFETNVFGIVRVTRAFLPLLERSDNPVIVNVSSGMGSLAVTTDPSRLESTLVSLGYPASKAAVNMLTSQYAKAFPELRVNAVDPGYTSTDFNDHRGTKSVERGAEIIVRMAELDRSGPTGTFVDEQGSVPW
jgi:NAD(P)-dependent dehydrogenase (short-subunit alcohol dehydrogenase family)